MQEENINVNGINYPLKIFYETRNSVRASIGKNGVIIRIPISLNTEEQFKEIIKMKTWAMKKIQEKPIKFQQKEYKDGEGINVGNKNYILSIVFKDKDGSSGRILGNTIKLSISQNLSKERQNKHISSLISSCLAYEYRPYIKKKIHSLNQTYFNNQLINKIFLKNTSSLWGSCSENNNINISTRLLFAPDDVLTYVCIHELSHLTEKNHSQQFWRLVENAMPDYKDKIKWLKDHGYKCEF